MYYQVSILGSLTPDPYLSLYIYINIVASSFIAPHSPQYRPLMAGARCCENPPILSSSCGVGAVEEIAGFKAYVTGSAISKLAVLLVSDVYGIVFRSVRVHLLFS